MLIPCRFDVIGEHITRIVNAGFIIGNEPIQRMVVENGTPTMGVAGRIVIMVESTPITVGQARVTAYRNGVIYDYVDTDLNGNYVLYLEDGTYDIRIEGESYNRTLRNYPITGGIKPYSRVIVKGQVTIKSFDTIGFAVFDGNGNPTDDGLRLVNGTVIDENGNRIEGAEIVVARSSDHSIVAFVRTDPYGRYSFVIPNDDDYDVVLRSPDHDVKVVRNYHFLDTNGFIPPLANGNLTFREGGDYIWILS